VRRSRVDARVGPTHQLERKLLAKNKIHLYVIFQEGHNILRNALKQKTRMALAGPVYSMVCITSKILEMLHGFQNKALSLTSAVRHGFEPSS
jgi:hypothetical protein